MIEWFRKGKLLKSAGRIFISEDPFSGRGTLTIRGCDLTDAGEYTVAANNTVNAIYAVVNVSIQGKPRGVGKKIDLGSKTFFFKETILYKKVLSEIIYRQIFRFFCWSFWFKKKSVCAVFSFLLYDCFRKLYDRLTTYRFLMYDGVPRALLTTSKKAHRDLSVGSFFGVILSLERYFEFGFLNGDKNLSDYFSFSDLFTTGENHSESQIYMANFADWFSKTIFFYLCF